jgi:hypothetical protein
MWRKHWKHRVGMQGILEYERKYLTVRGTISDRKMDLLVTGPGCSRHLLLERKN